jgi:hypothetical protein
MSTFVLAEYLDDAESAKLKETLDAAGIPAIKKRHGLPRFFGVEINFKVMIEQSDLQKAGPLYRTFSDDLAISRAERKKLNTTQCPWCASKNISIKEKKSIWEKFRFYGV